MRLYCEDAGELLFTENETNNRRLFDAPNAEPYVKDGINDCVVGGRRDAVNPRRRGHEVRGALRARARAGREPDRSLAPVRADVAQAVRRLRRDLPNGASPRPTSSIATSTGSRVSDDERAVQRQALAGLLWSKQFYNYVVHDWLHGDPLQPPPPAARERGRNSGWDHFYSDDVLSMPDTWEYPWFAAWDLAFHCVALTLVDPEFAKVQLSLLTREWYMHPNGQVPAYEWALRRRQSAGSGVGGVSRLSRSSTSGPGVPTTSSSSASSRSCCSRSRGG